MFFVFHESIGCYHWTEQVLKHSLSKSGCFGQRQNVMAIQTCTSSVGHRLTLNLLLMGPTLLNTQWTGSDRLILPTGSSWWTSRFKRTIPRWKSLIFAESYGAEPLWRGRTCFTCWLQLGYASWRQFSAPWRWTTTRGHPVTEYDARCCMEISCSWMFWDQMEFRQVTSKWLYANKKQRIPNASSFRPRPLRAQNRLPQLKRQKILGPMETTPVEDDNSDRTSTTRRRRRGGDNDENLERSASVSLCNNTYLTSRHVWSETERKSRVTTSDEGGASELTIETREPQQGESILADITNLSGFYAHPVGRPASPPDAMNSSGLPHVETSGVQSGWFQSTRLPRRAQAHCRWIFYSSTNFPSDSHSPQPEVFVPCSHLHFIRNQLMDFAFGTPGTKAQLVKWHDSTQEAFESTPVWHDECPSHMNFSQMAHRPISMKSVKEQRRSCWLSTPYMDPALVALIALQWTLQHCSEIWNCCHAGSPSLGRWACREASVFLAPLLFWVRLQSCWSCSCRSLDTISSSGTSVRRTFPLSLAAVSIWWVGSWMEAHQESHWPPLEWSSRRSKLGSCGSVGALSRSTLSAARPTSVELASFSSPWLWFWNTPSKADLVHRQLMCVVFISLWRHPLVRFLAHRIILWFLVKMELSHRVQGTRSLLRWDVAQQTSLHYSQKALEHALNTLLFNFSRKKYTA